MNDPGDEDIIPRDDEESENKGADTDQDREVPQIPEDDPLGVPPEFVERISAAWFSGPLPPPEVLQGYKEAEPAAPQIILTMAEKEQGQRHHTERSFMRKCPAASDTARSSSSLCSLWRATPSSTGK